MNEYELPSYAFLVVAAVVIANLATAWIVLLTMKENSGDVYSAGPPWLAVISVFCLFLSHYKAILPLEVSFWGSAFLGAAGLWGAWVDYTHLSNRKKALEKTDRSPRSRH